MTVSPRLVIEASSGQHVGEFMNQVIELRPKSGTIIIHNAWVHEFQTTDDHKSLERSLDRSMGCGLAEEVE